MDEQIEQRVRQQEAIVDLGRQALGGADLCALMQSVTELVAETLGVEFCKVLELLPGNDALILRAGVGWKEGSYGTGNGKRRHELTSRLYVALQGAGDCYRSSDRREI